MNESEALHNKNFFELFSLPLGFNIDSKLLRENYRSLQSKFHPDQFSSASESEKIKAVQTSSLLNDAFVVLSNPVKRANYILQLSGINIQEDRKIDASILTEQMEFREQLEDLKALDDESKERELLLFQNKIQKLFEAACLDFSQSHETNNGSEKDLNRMKQNLSRMLFLDKLQTEIEQVLEEFD